MTRDYIEFISVSHYHVIATIEMGNASNISIEELSLGSHVTRNVELSAIDLTQARLNAKLWEGKARRIN